MAATLTTAIPRQLGIQGEAFSLDLSNYFSGADSYSITGLSADTALSLDAQSGVLSGAPGADDLGTHTITATAEATDGDASDSFELRIEPDAGEAHPDRTLSLQDARLIYEQAKSERLDYDVLLGSWLEQVSDEYASHEIEGDSSYVDDSQAISGDRIKVWVQGVEEDIVVRVVVTTAYGRTREADLVVRRRDTNC